ncbi:MAG TPA: TIGR04255 family protein [Gemmatimonadaceae bacterium]
MSYKQAILVELYADFRLAPGSFGFDRFFDVVPRLRDRGFPNIESGSVNGFDVNLFDQKLAAAFTPPRVRCWSSDRTRLVQLAPDDVTMNLVTPAGTYPGWRTFREEVVAPTLGSLHATIEVSITAVALNTIDRFTVPSAGFQLGQYIRCGGPVFPESFASVTQTIDVDMGFGLIEPDGFNRQVHLHGKPVDGSYVVQVQSIFQNALADGGNALELLERLHDESDEHFEKWITDTTRNVVMKGTVDAVSV